ncbi:hypothetical protein V6N13_049314 [Hibiscus sabdariffa]
MAGFSLHLMRPMIGLVCGLFSKLVQRTCSMNVTERRDHCDLLSIAWWMDIVISPISKTLSEAQLLCPSMAYGELVKPQHFHHTDMSQSTTEKFRNNKTRKTNEKRYYLRNEQISGRQFLIGTSYVNGKIIQSIYSVPSDRLKHMDDQRGS